MANVYLPIFDSPTALQQQPWETSDTAKYPLGTKLESRDGRIWRYARAGGTQLAKGLMGQATPIHANVDTQTQDSMGSNKGDYIIDVKFTAGHGYVAGDFAEGWLLIEDATGAGYRYRVQTNTVVTDDTIHRLFLHEPIVEATSADTIISVLPNPYSKVIVAPQTTLTSMCVGVATCVVTATHYYWAQRKGPCAVLVDASDTVVIGNPVGQPHTQAAAGTFGVVSTTGTTPVWGVVLQATAHSKYCLVHLTLE